MQADSLIVTRTVDWFHVHRLVAPVLEQIESWPLAGTLAWHRLADTDPAKWAAVLDLGRHFALRLDSEQRALTDASREIATAEECWSAMARRVHDGRGHAYIKRERSISPRKRSA